MKLTAELPCPDCHGTGTDNERRMGNIDCQRCKGWGKILLKEVPRP